MAWAYSLLFQCAIKLLKNQSLIHKWRIVFLRLFSKLMKIQGHFILKKNQDSSFLDVSGSSFSTRREMFLRPSCSMTMDSIGSSQLKISWTFRSNKKREYSRTQNAYIKIVIVRFFSQYFRTEKTSLTMMSQTKWSLLVSIIFKWTWKKKNERVKLHRSWSNKYSDGTST